MIMKAKNCLILEIVTNITGIFNCIKRRQNYKLFLPVSRDLRISYFFVYFLVYIFVHFFVYRCMASDVPGHDFDVEVFDCGDWAFDPAQGSCVWDDIDNDLC